jgi:hypothetical protein
MCVCVCVCVCVYVCMYLQSLIARERTNSLAPDLACLFLEIRKVTKKGEKSGSFLSSISRKGDSYSSETTHDRETAHRRKLFASKRRL